MRSGFLKRNENGHGRDFPAGLLNMIFCWGARSRAEIIPVEPDAVSTVEGKCESHALQCAALA